MTVTHKDIVVPWSFVTNPKKWWLMKKLLQTNKWEVLQQGDTEDWLNGWANGTKLTGYILQESGPLIKAAKEESKG